MIANPQSIKRLGHFLTTDCKSVETPNGGNKVANPSKRLTGIAVIERVYSVSSIYV